MAGRDLVRDVTHQQVIVLEPPSSPPGELASDSRSGATGPRIALGPRIAMIDTGVKALDRAQPARARRHVELHPATATAADLLADDPDAIFLANGPGDPAALGYIVQTVRTLIGKRPVYGICLGHQLLCRRSGSPPTSCRSATMAPTTRSRT